MTMSPNDFPEPENNWANTYATTYQVPAENKLQRKTYDIGKQRIDISGSLCITHWWGLEKEFYINKHSDPSDCEAVRLQMQILSVISGQEHLSETMVVHNEDKSCRGPTSEQAIDILKMKWRFEIRSSSDIK
ncbi:hypothetical protein Tco_0802275 [Tanacetum coccineum]|uniref:Uncharacterized protein n=1 Tax=Tanacetum coccineum TaxID=301880 RepID=A0ABQ5A2J8_9ASTR